MQLLIEIGYKKIVLPVEGDEIAGLLKALSKAQEVESNGYGSDARYTRSALVDIDLKLLPDERFEGEASSLVESLYAKLDKAQSSTNDYILRAHKSDMELKRIQKLLVDAGITITEQKATVTVASAEPRAQIEAPAPEPVDLDQELTF